MRDRVAEVLAERAALDGGTAAGLALSIALHAGVTAAVIYAALHHPAPEMTSVLNIKFAPIAPQRQETVVAKPKAADAAAPHREEPKPKPVPVKNTAPPDAFGR